VWNRFEQNRCCHCGQVSDFTAQQADSWLTSFLDNAETC
jgi:hypothetical protein